MLLPSRGGKGIRFNITMIKFKLNIMLRNVDKPVRIRPPSVPTILINPIEFGSKNNAAFIPTLIAIPQDMTINRFAVGPAAAIKAAFLGLLQAQIVLYGVLA